MYAQRTLGSQAPVGYVAEFFFGPGGDVAPRGAPASELRAKWQGILEPASP